MGKKKKKKKKKKNVSNTVSLMLDLVFAPKSNRKKRKTEKWERKRVGKFWTETAKKKKESQKHKGFLVKKNVTNRTKQES